ncbi:MAG: biotin/lipoyl-containing protein [Candidatus Thorarchaeota archaeon]
MKHTVHLKPNPDTSDFTIKMEKESFIAALKAETEKPVQSFQPTSIAPTPSTMLAPTQVPTQVAQVQAAPGTVTAPLPGRVLEVRVKSGTTVKHGDVLLVLEAMKMANEIRAPQDGTVTKIHVEAGTAVEKGQPMISIQ